MLIRMPNNRLLPFLRGLQLFFKTIPVVPSLLLSDNITFIDVLGRRASLSYVEFCHWPVSHRSQYSTKCVGVE